MTKKEIRQVEKIAKKILEDMLSVEGETFIEGYDEFIFTAEVLDEIESYQGHPIMFMAIS